MEPGKKIRKLVWGIVPTLPTRIVSLGSTVRIREPKAGIVDYIISEITENKDAFWESGSVEFDVYISKTKESKDQIFWQRYSLRPDLIEYNFDEIEEYII